ncbi:MAG TPA: hypothetical protein VGR57_19365, partial [Ktedonobacterales bacterium]|nr:hypothetical protein [Ktedonobacterales bacterium]
AALALTVLSFLAHRARARHRSASATTGALGPVYGLKRVDQLDPNDYVPRYVQSVYQPRRDAATGAADDDLARATLRAAADGAAGAPWGICVFGRPTQGKTRLAWEALRATLPEWTLLRWPHGAAAPFDYAHVNGQKLALWLDDLWEYANPSEAPSLSDLPRRLREAGARVVVVATCRDGDDEKRTRELLGALLEHLTALRPADITRGEATQLAADLAVAHPADQEGAVYADEFDGTPGSLLLGVRRMAEQRYPALPEDGRRVLRALKLLRSAQSYDYPETRVRTVAGDLFGLPSDEGAWQTARAALVASDFLRLGEADSAGRRALEPVADVYLERAVPDYPTAGASEADDWPRLRLTLERQRDAAALVSLGIAFNERSLGDLRANQEQAIACYRAALEVYTRASAPADWATTQNNLGLALAAQAGLAEGDARARLLGEAVAAYRAAQEVYTRASDPVNWATTQNNLANALLAQARRAEGEARARSLEEAVAAYHAALEVRTRASAPAAWAMTQNNLAIT